MFQYIYEKFSWTVNLSVKTRGVQNRINPIEKPQTKPIQTKTAKNDIWFGCIQINFLLNRMI